MNISMFYSMGGGILSTNIVLSGRGCRTKNEGLTIKKLKS